MDVEGLLSKARSQATENKKFLEGLKRKNAARVDETFHHMHEEVFSEFDCLQCANCCKTTSPIFYQVDIERAAKALRIKPGDFVEKYLRIDEDGDHVLTASPCPFLGADNYCSIYESRPKACREYPHTDRKRMTQITNLTYKNTMVCPAVAEMVDRIKKLMA